MRLLLALAMLIAVPAQADHTWIYAVEIPENPVEHDDQGRSDEPDFARTGVLGPWLENRVLDLDGDGRATPDSALPPVQPGHANVIAPGCSNDAGRQPSGLCGLCTVGAAPLPPGVLFCLDGGQPPPGAYMTSRGTRVRFLDVHTDVYLIPPAGGALRLDVNHKVGDALGGAAPGAFLLGPMTSWAWLGDWQDKNANGVIDHLGDSRGNLSRANEFVWRGGCLRFTGEPGGGPFCVPDGIRPPMAAYAFPGNHHATCGPVLPTPVSTCGLTPSDHPGRQVVWWLVEGWESLDGTDEAYFGDPLLGPQASVRPDFLFRDLTGERSISARGWHSGPGWPTWYYDQSLLVSHVFVAAYDAPMDPRSPNRFDLARARFLDVDEHRSLNPSVEDLVQGLVKPKARALWVFVRDEAVPV